MAAGMDTTGIDPGSAMQDSRTPDQREIDTLRRALREAEERQNILEVENHELSIKLDRMTLGQGSRGPQLTSGAWTPEDPGSRGPHLTSGARMPEGPEDAREFDEKTLLRDLVADIKSSKEASIHLMHALKNNTLGDAGHSHYEVSKKREADRLFTIKPTKFSKPTVLKSTEQFLTEYKKFCETWNADAVQMYEGLEKYLEGEALATYKTYKVMFPTGSFQGIACELLREFAKLSTDEYQKAYWHRHQGEEESVVTYAREMKLLMAATRLPEQDKVHAFINNLKPSTRRVVLGRGPMTFDQTKRNAEDDEATAKENICMWTQGWQRCRHCSKGGGGRAELSMVDTTPKSTYYSQRQEYGTGDATTMLAGPEGATPHPDSTTILSTGTRPITMASTIMATKGMKAGLHLGMQAKGAIPGMSRDAPRTAMDGRVKIGPGVPEVQDRKKAVGGLAAEDRWRRDRRMSPGRSSYSREPYRTASKSPYRQQGQYEDPRRRERNQEDRSRSWNYRRDSWGSDRPRNADYKRERSLSTGYKERSRTPHPEKNNFN